MPILPTIDILNVRVALNMSQEKFAKTFAIPLATLRNWEQNRTQPDAAALLALHLINQMPSACAAMVARISS